MWVYNFPTTQLVTLRCWKNNPWTTHTVSLAGNGLVANATGCSITTGTFHTFPELQGRSQSTLNAPHFHLPENLRVTANDQLTTVDESKPADLTQLDDINSHLKARQQTRRRFFIPHTSNFAATNTANPLLQLSALLRSSESFIFLSDPVYTAFL
jgi:hypothetical protein